jgi:hypothetical protein
MSRRRQGSADSARDEPPPSQGKRRRRRQWPLRLLFTSPQHAGERCRAPPPRRLARSVGRAIPARRLRRPGVAATAGEAATVVVEATSGGGWELDQKKITKTPR